MGIRSRQQVSKGGLFGQKGIVPMIGGHLAVLGCDAGCADRIRKLADGLRRKQPVRTYTHKA